jgi:hypothetical protein
VLAFLAGMAVMAWTGVVVHWILSRPWRRDR